MTTHFLAAAEEPDKSFDQPWQVEAFATVVMLTRRGVFGWPEWAETFAAVAKEQPASAGETVTESYYRQWTTALEELLDEHVGVQGDVLEGRVQQWREAYLGTPHGHPVELANYLHCTPAVAQAHQDHGHEHDHMMISRDELRQRVKPITVDPSRASCAESS